jgi:phosphomannomutase
MVMSGRAIYGEDIQKLKARIETETYTAKRGRSATMDIGAEYARRITRDCKLARR